MFKETHNVTDFGIGLVLDYAKLGDAPALLLP